jgi:Rhs element Vgr protein
MADSPLDLASGTVSFTLKVDGKKLKTNYPVMEINVEKDVNRVGEASVVIVLPHGDNETETFKYSEEDIFIPGAEIEILAGYDSEDNTIFKGLIVNHGIRVSPQHANILKIKCSDKACKLKLDRKNKYYKDKKDSDIINEVIQGAGLTGDVDATTYQHKQLIQYHAIDWDFIQARAGANGLLTYFEDDKLHVKKPTTSEDSGLVVDYFKDVIAFKGEIESRKQLPKVTCHSWDMKTQKILEGASSEPTIHAQGNITGKKLSEVVGAEDYELHTTAPVEKAFLKNWADGVLLQARLSGIRGTVTFMGNEKPKINTLLELKGFGKRFNGKALITGIQHAIRAGQWRTTVRFGLSPDWYSEHRSMHAPEAADLLPAINGLQIGTVKKIHEDEGGEHRIQVDVPVIAPTGDGIWARLAQFYATSGSKGAFWLPEVNDEVILGFLNDDPRFPVILGMLYSSKNAPPYTADQKNSIKAIVTKNDLKLEFDDDQKIITTETPGKNKIIISDKDKSITIQDQHGNKIEMAQAGITIESAKDITMKAKGKVTIEANLEVGVTAKTDLKMEGLNVNVKAKASLSAQGTASAELKAAGNTTVKGAMVMIN